VAERQQALKNFFILKLATFPETALIKPVNWDIKGQNKFMDLGGIYDFVQVS